MYYNSTYNILLFYMLYIICYNITYLITLVQLHNIGEYNSPPILCIYTSITIITIEKLC